MKPDEMRTHIKQVPGLKEFPINDHEHLIRLLRGKDKEIKFKDKKLTTADVLRMFPANYFPITSEEDLTAKAVKLIELGRDGFQAATGARPEKESGPPAAGKEHEAKFREKEYKEKFREHDVDGYPK